MGFLKKIANSKVGGKLLGGYISGKVNREVESVAEHFEHFLEPILAKEDFERTESYQIRHSVYCEELKFEDEKTNKQEIDQFDDFSLISLIRHKPSNKFAGTVRVVCPQSDDQQLPIQAFCSHAYKGHALNPDLFDKNKICEISRLAVLADFRRRKMDAHEGAATGAINEQTYSEMELRCFPFISIGLYLMSASSVIEKGIEHAYVMMEPRLARSMALVGIKFEQLGPAVEYHGLRAPYYICPEMFLKNLSPGFKSLHQSIQRSIHDQLLQ